MLSENTKHSISWNKVELSGPDFNCSFRSIGCNSPLLNYADLSSAPFLGRRGVPLTSTRTYKSLCKHAYKTFELLTDEDTIRHHDSTALASGLCKSVIVRLKPTTIKSPSVENLKFKVDERLYEIPVMARPVEPKIEIRTGYFLFYESYRVVVYHIYYL